MTFVYFFFPPSFFFRGEECCIDMYTCPCTHAQSVYVRQSLESVDCGAWRWSSEYTTPRVNVSQEGRKLSQVGAVTSIFGGLRW